MMGLQIFFATCHRQDVLVKRQIYSLYLIKHQRNALYVLCTTNVVTYVVTYVVKRQSQVMYVCTSQASKEPILQNSPTFFIRDVDISLIRQVCLTKAQS